MTHARQHEDEDGDAGTSSPLSSHASPLQAVLVSNGPGELYTWVRPVLEELRTLVPDARVVISLIPCQFASGREEAIARTFGADVVTTPGEFVRYMTLGTPPAGLRPESHGRGFVLSMGGNTALALQLAEKLRLPGYRYSFVPYWNKRLKRLFVHDEKARRKARLLGAPRDRLECIGNLVADAVQNTDAITDSGSPHIYLNPGSRDGFAIHLIPFMIAVVDELAGHYPRARFVWPVSRLLRDETITAGIAGREKATLGGRAGERQNDTVVTPNGHRLELIPEEARYSHMRAADLAITIPGTNTLELGIAGVPGVVILPLNKPEAIPLEGPGHWLSLIPVVGTSLKRQAVRLAAPRFPVALPNSLSGEELMVEIKGEIELGQIVAETRRLLDDPDELARRRVRLQATMPGPGAARRLVRAVLEDIERL